MFNKFGEIISYLQLAFFSSRKNSKRHHLFVRFSLACAVVELHARRVRGSSYARSECKDRVMRETRHLRSTPLAYRKQLNNANSVGFIKLQLIRSRIVLIVYQQRKRRIDFWDVIDHVLSSYALREFIGTTETVH